MLQNRVDPYGNIIKTRARGHWMGNRGQLHDENKKLLRSFKLKAWITCLLQFNGRRREVMARRRYTELFFWDEATSFAAGHRPCFECRRQDYTRFKHFWLEGNKEFGFADQTSISEIDKILHQQRISSKDDKITYEAELDTLPDGCFIELNGQASVIYQGSVFAWTVGGYGDRASIPLSGKLKVLTPQSTVNAIRAGYAPEVTIS